MVVFDCPFGNVYPGPEFLITVNFTTLGINATFPSSAIFSAVSILVGLNTNALDMNTNTLDIIHNTLPIPLVPNVHLLGGVIQNIREQFNRPGLASLGIFSSVCPSVHVFTHIVIKPLRDARQKHSIHVLSHSCCQTPPCKFLETTTLPRYACTYKTITLTGISLLSIERNLSLVDYPHWEASGRCSTDYLPRYLVRLCCLFSLVSDVLLHIAEVY